MSQQDTTVNTTPMKARQTAEKQKFLQLGTIRHIDVTKLPGVVQTVDAMKEMAFSARDLGPRPAVRGRADVEGRRPLGGDQARPGTDARVPRLRSQGRLRLGRRPGFTGA